MPYAKVTADEISSAVLKVIRAKDPYEDDGPMYHYISDTNGWPWKKLYYDGRVAIPNFGTLKVVDRFDESKDGGHFEVDRPTHVMIFTVDDNSQLFWKAGWRDSWDEYVHDDGPVLEVERYMREVVAYREKK